jgi:leucyl/phenylalanyl-tRNA--protein transferase
MTDTILTPRLLLSAYAQGYFPMADGEEIHWYDPHPRAILPLEAFHLPRSLAKTLRKGVYEIRVNQQFERVMSLCAEPAPDRPQTWINPTLTQLYTQLHLAGFAHSVETYQDGHLVGGLYGVSLGGLFAGESMFSRARDASKVALAHLVERLRLGGYTLLDTQFQTEHLARFGVVQIPRGEYKRRLALALTIQADFYKQETYTV